MIRSVAILAFSTLVTGAGLWADSPSGQPVQATDTQQISFAPGGVIRLNAPFGSLSVEGWDQAQVEVSVVRSMGFDYEPSSAATRHLDSVKVTTERRSDSELVISTTRTRIHNRFTHAVGIGADPTVEYRIRVPRNSHLIVSHANGYVSVTGVTGDIEATDRRGDIVLMLPNLAAYSIDASTKLGVVTSDLAGATHSRRLVGESFNHGDQSLARKLKLRMGVGGITIKELPPESLEPVKAGAK